MLKQLRNELRAHATDARKKTNERYFKTGPQEYGFGDIFLGVTVPDIRKIAKNFSSLSYSEIAQLLESHIHEERLCALIILVNRYKKTKQYEIRKEIFNFYCQHIGCVNNWDLVDTSAPYLVGAYLFEIQNFEILHRWIISNNLWERRIALLATHYCIRNNSFEQTFLLAEQVLYDKHDLIHKASGWMLREVGERNIDLLRNFLNQHYIHMPRTMLRYAIEKLTKEERTLYLAKIKK